MFNKISVERRAGETGRNFPVYGFYILLFRQMKCYGERWYEGSIGSMGMVLLFIVFLNYIVFLWEENMNHIYKVIWSRVKNSYVVVSEIAGTARKSGRVRVSKNTLAAVLAAFLLTGISVSPVSAALDGVNTFVEPGNQNIKIGNGTDLRNNSTKNGAIAIGDHAQIDDYVMQEGSIAIGKNAFVENMWGTQDKIFRFGMHSTDPSRTDHLLPAGVAIGQNTYARSGSLMIGDHKYVGDLGDTTVNSNTDDEKRKLSVLVGATTVGLNSYSAGAFATTTGAYSIMTNAYDGNTNQGSAAQNFGAVINGSFNSIESKTSGSSVSGIANAVVGTANRTHNANGTLVFGAGNEVTNSVDNIANPMSFLGINSPKELAEKLREDIRRNDSGGAVLAIGGGNKADYAYRSQLVGVGNTLEGTAAEKAAYNLLNGYRNTGTNVSGVTVIGTNRTVSNAKDTIVMGSSAGGITTTASKAVILGSEANAEKDGGVALGADSVASVDKGAAGYDPSTDTASTDTSATWKATAAAVSIGKAATPTSAAVTRQITNVAAGTQDTDAVNVAQLKKVQAAAGAAKVHYYSAKSTKTGAGSNYDNDGAEAEDSIVLGISSSSEGVNSTVLGNNNKLTGVKNGRNNSIVAGQNLDVEGVHNAVFGTDYNNYDHKLTKVFGEENTVIGLGNLVGYTAEKDPSDPTKWIYTKNSSGSDQNVAVGMKNTANGGSVVVGTSSEAENLGVSFGHGNKVIGLNNGGGYRGLALGSNLTVKGEEAVAVGTNASATADWAIAMGKNSKAEKETAMAFGYDSHAKVNHGVALGAWSVADTAAGVSGYDPSTKAASTDTSAAWKSTLGAVSVGDKTEGYTRQITNVAAGATDTDAVNVAQLKKAVAGAADGNDTLVGGSNGLSLSGKTLSMSVKDTAGNEVKGSVDLSSVADGNDTLVRDNNALTLNGKELSMKIKDTAGNEVKGSVDLSAIAGQIDTNTTYTMSGTQNADNTTTITLKGSDGKENKVTVATKDTRNTVKAGENVTLDTAANTFGGTEYTVNVKADGKVENGSTKIVSGNTVYHETHVKNDGNYVKKENSAGDNLTILDKQVGKNTTNITNLGNTINNLNGKLGTLDNRISKVGAGAAALAALHPLDFDPHDKWDIAAGFGNYRNASAAAVGLFYRPNERTMMSLGWTMGDDRNMLNAGISVKLGRGDVYTRYSKVEMANQIKDLKEKNDKMQAENKEMRSELDELKAQVAALAAKK